MNEYNYLIVGAGFSGAVIAERLKSIGKTVLIIDKREHIGGNSYDFYNDDGVLVHKYGPHYFRTDHEEVKRYLSKFTEWHVHRYKVRVSIDNKLYEFPINRNTLNEFFGVSLENDDEAIRFLDSKKENIENPKNAEEQVLAFAGKDIYDSFFKNYTKKQWGVDPKDLEPSVTARIPIRFDTNDDYLDAKFQAMPKDGYFKLFEKILEEVEVKLNTDFNEIKSKIKFQKLIYTGPIDEYFDCKYGKLPYRSLNFISETYAKKYYQKFGQINFPNEHEWTRIVEIKHVTGQKCSNTTIVKEVPKDDGDPFYPIPNCKNHDLYLRYEEESLKLDDVYFLGRLAQYKYLNMDQVIKNALDLFNEIMNRQFS